MLRPQQCLDTKIIPQWMNQKADISNYSIQENQETFANVLRLCKVDAEEKFAC